MSKSIKFRNGVYIDDSCLVHGKTLLSEYLISLMFNTKGNTCPSGQLDDANNIRRQGIWRANGNNNCKNYPTPESNGLLVVYNVWDQMIFQLYICWNGACWSRMKWYSNDFSAWHIVNGG